jgi:uncharacterized protein YukE
MATIAVTPETLRERSGRTTGIAEAVVAAYGALAAIVPTEAGDPLLAAALTEFAQAWARVLPLLSERARMHGAALRAAADDYVDTDGRAAGARD